MREEDRVFKPSHRVHALVEQANAIQQGRVRPTELLHKFYLGDERIITQTVDHVPPPTAVEMRGDRGLLDMFGWGQDEGNTTFEKHIAIQSGIADKFEQQFKAAPEIVPYKGELLKAPEPKVSIYDIIRPPEIHGPNAPIGPVPIPPAAQVPGAPPPPPVSRVRLRRLCSLYLAV
jgi:hypothetical protein